MKSGNPKHCRVQLSVIIETGEPGCSHRQQAQLRLQSVSVQAPLFVFLLALLGLLTTLFAQVLLLFFLGFAGTPTGAPFGFCKLLCRKFLAGLLLPSHLPSRIFQLAAFTQVASFDAQLVFCLANLLDLGLLRWSRLLPWTKKRLRGFDESLHGFHHQLQVKHFNNLSRIDIGTEFG